MKKIVFVLCLLGMLCFSCKDTKQTNNEVIRISAQEMQNILELEDVQLVDVRTPKEYKEIRISNAQNIDYLSPTFDDDITKLDKKKPVILYCKSGGRSAKCAQKLKDAGFEKVYELEGGISKWKHSNEIKIEGKS